MLLACCFKEQKTKPKKRLSKQRSYQKLGIRVDSKLKPQISAPVTSTARKITNGNTTTSSLHGNGILSPISLYNDDKTICLQDTSHIESQMVNSLKNQRDPSVNKKDVSPMFASSEDLESSDLSLSTSNQNVQHSNKSLYSTSMQPLKLDTCEKLSSVENSIVYSSEAHEKRVELEYQSSKYDIQADAGTQATLKEVMEGNELANILVLKIQQDCKEEVKNLKLQHQIILERERKNFQRLLNDEKQANQKNSETEKENYEKELEKAFTKAKNEANETICQLNKQIVMERAKMMSEHQENSKRLEEEFQMKEDRLNRSLNLLNQSLNLIEEREQAWHTEKSFVVQEVEKLKKENTRLIMLLERNDNEDNLSDDKKKSLSQEVSSLNVVIEMRTEEIKRLKEQLAVATEKLVEFNTVKESQAKCMAKVEDLEEQLAIKNRKEKQFMEEKTHMEQNVRNMSKELDHMRRTVETMQWSIRNNFYFPGEKKTVLTDQEEQIKRRVSLPTKLCTTELKTKEMTSLTNNYKSNQVDLSPCSDAGIRSFEDEDFLKESEAENCLKETCSIVKNVLQVNIDTIDMNRESIDEGVEDISSDCDLLHSPTFQSEPQRNVEQKNQSNDEDNTVNNITRRKKSRSSADSGIERMPSRFSFGNL